MDIKAIFQIIELGPLQIKEQIKLDKKQMEGISIQDRLVYINERFAELDHIITGLEIYKEEIEYPQSEIVEEYTLPIVMEVFDDITSKGYNVIMRYNSILFDIAEFRVSMKFDPVNGVVAISLSALSIVQLNKISKKRLKAYLKLIKEVLPDYERVNNDAYIIKIWDTSDAANIMKEAIERLFQAKEEFEKIMYTIT